MPESTRKRFAGRSRIGVVLLVSALLGGALTCLPAFAATEDPSVAEVVTRVRALQEEISDLLNQLPPELRQRVEEELRRSATEADAVESAAPTLPTTTDSTSGPGPPAPSPPAGAPARQPEASDRPSSPVSISEPGLSAQALETRPRARRRMRCERLAPLDGNGDGQISAVDRYWRHLYVWQDRNRDGTWQDSEIRSAYEAGVRGIATDLDTFSRKKGALGEIRLRDGEVWLDLRGDGFREDGRGDDAVLMFDASALARGSGPALLGPSGEQLAGKEPLRPGLQWRDLDGRISALDCP